MKKIIFLLCILFSTLSFSQLQKVEYEKPSITTKIAPMGSFWASAEVYEDYVTITFQDAEFTKITRLVHFGLTPEDFKNVGITLTSDDNKEGDFYSIKTTDGKILAFKFSKMMGTIYPIIILDGARFPNLSKSQFRKLFNIQKDK